MDKLTTAIVTKTSRGVRVSIIFVVLTAAVAALIGATAVVARMLSSYNS